jgi:hypothetical protein
LSVLHKMRQAIARKDQDYRLEGTIIIDDAFPSVLLKIKNMAAAPK